MYEKNLNCVLEQYIACWDKLDDPKGCNEGFKWKAVGHFQTNWDIDAEDFPAMFNEATKETSVLIDLVQSRPTSGIKALLEIPVEIEYVRRCFRDLFVEDGGDLKDRQNRLERFVDQINERIEKYYPTSHMFPQTMRSALCYLNLWKPEENYIFKYTEAVHFADAVEFADDFGQGSTFSLTKYYRMCDEVREVLENNKEICELYKTRVEKDGKGFDDKMHLLVYDVIYCAETYSLHKKLQSGLPPKKVAEKAQARQRYEELKWEVVALEAEIEAEEEITLPDMKGIQLLHKTYGKGTAVGIQNGMVVINFDVGQKKFEYPGAIEKGFLKPVDSSIAEVICRNKEQKKRIDDVLKKLSPCRAELEELKKAYNFGD